MKTVDRIIKIISWMTVAGLVGLMMARWLGMTALPHWIEVWAVPILTAGAVGYLTNWIAIWLLFKPYQKRWGRIQGIIPRNKEHLGRELGRVIPQYLLKPEELADQLGGLVRDYLQDPSLMADIRQRVNGFFKHYRTSIARFIFPYIEGPIKEVIRENLTVEQLASLYDSLAAKWLDRNEENRDRLATAIARELQRRTPELTGTIRENMKAGTLRYIKVKLPMVARFIDVAVFTDNLIDALDWRMIQSQLADKFGDAKTHQTIGDELARLSGRLRDWLKSPEAEKQLGEFMARNQKDALDLVRAYLEEHLPEFVDSLFKKDAFWLTVQGKLLPVAQGFVLHELSAHGTAIIGKFDLSGKIEHAVSGMDMAQLHQMLNRVSGEHLVAIQVLGYWLGALAGLLMIFAA